MSQIQNLSAAASEWIFKIAASVLPKVKIPAESPIGKFMYGFIGVDPNSYNLWNELGFLAEPMIQTMVTPVVGKFMSGIPEEQVKEIALKFADAFVTQAQQKGSVNLFGLQMGENAFADLKSMLVAKFEE